MRRVNLLELMESRRDQMRVSIRTPIETVDVNVWDELQIDEHDLNTEFMALPGQIAYWAAVTARFAQAVEAVRRDYDNWYAPIYDQEFAKLENATGRRPNISSIEYMVRIQHKDEFNRRRDILEQAEADLKTIQGVITALEAKLQSLMQLAKKQIVEYNSTDVSYKGGGLPRISTPQHTSSYRKPDGPGIEEARGALRKMRSGS